MIIHKLILHHLGHRDDSGFYLVQAQDAIGWLERNGVKFGPGVSVLDLGCGHGVFGGELVKRGCEVVFADESKTLFPELASLPFRQINLDKDDVSQLGRHDVVICSNVLEHLSKPERFIASAATLLKPSGKLFLSWTNWLSPWGGHDFSPFHYLGERRGHVIWDKLVGRKRIHTPFETLYPTYIGQTLQNIRRQPNLKIRKISPRYYPEFGFIMSIPVLREFLAWNCALLIERTK